ncbi:hypothetical protein [Cronobacter phage vB_Cdu_VP8]|nr:hypothetical protein [Cronobacter phage vB_Cdu_VP8]
METINVHQNIFDITIGKVFTIFKAEGMETILMNTADIKDPRIGVRILQKSAPQLKMRECIDILNNCNKLIKGAK